MVFLLGDILKPFTKIIILFILIFAIYFGIKQSEDEGVTPLMMAARSGNVTELIQSISNGESINEISKFGWTALMFASWKGHEKAVNILLDKGADPNIVSSYVPSPFETVGGYPPTTALAEAIHNNSLSIAKILIIRGAKIDPLSIAYSGSEGDVNFLEYLNGYNVDWNTPSGNAFYPTALGAASRYGKTDAVKWLLLHGADPNLFTFNQSALKEAIEGSHPDIVKLLLNHGANPNLEFNNQTFLSYAASKYTRDEEHESNQEIIRNLLPYIENKDSILEVLHVLKIQRSSLAKANEKQSDPEIKERLIRSLNHKDSIITLLSNT